MNRRSWTGDDLDGAEARLLDDADTMGEDTPVTNRKVPPPPPPDPPPPPADDAMATGGIGSAPVPTLGPTPSTGVDPGAGTQEHEEYRPQPPVRTDSNPRVDAASDGTETSPSEPEPRRSAFEVVTPRAAPLDPPNIPYITPPPPAAAKPESQNKPLPKRVAPPPPDAMEHKRLPELLPPPRHQSMRNLTPEVIMEEDAEVDGPDDNQGSSNEGEIRKRLALTWWIL